MKACILILAVADLAIIALQAALLSQAHDREAHWQAQAELWEARARYVISIYADPNP